MTFIEFKDIERSLSAPACRIRGTAILQLNVKDLDALLKTLKAADIRRFHRMCQAVTSWRRIAPGDRPGCRTMLYLELIQRPDNKKGRRRSQCCGGPRL